MMEATTGVQGDIEEHYPENAIEDPAAVQHDGLHEMGGLPLSHAVREVRPMPGQPAPQLRGLSDCERLGCRNGTFPLEHSVNIRH